MRRIFVFDEASRSFRLWLGSEAAPSGFWLYATGFRMAAEATELGMIYLPEGYSPDIAKVLLFVECWEVFEQLSGPGWCWSPVPFDSSGDVVA